MRAVLSVIVNPHLVLFVILINSLVLFLDAFENINITYGTLLYGIDYACTLFFVIEIIIKLKQHGWRGFWQDRWNAFDFVIVALSSPTLAEPFLDTHYFSFFLVFRLARLLRYFLLLQFIPDHNHITIGIVRSLKASVGVFLVVLLYNFILALGSVYLFREFAPEHFGNPALALYSVFKVFTVEGWYEVPDLIASRSSEAFGALARVYFVFSVLTGGILGLSLANAVFVDQMTSDNLDATEASLKRMEKQIAEMSDNLEAMEIKHDARLARLQESLDKITKEE